VIAPASGRWSPRAKAVPVAAIDKADLTIEEVAALYALSPEELADWRRALAAHGVPGLRSTRIQCYPRRPDGLRHPRSEQHPHPILPAPARRRGRLNPRPSTGVRHIGGRAYLKLKPPPIAVPPPGAIEHDRSSAVPVCRKALGLSQPAMARALLIASDRTIRRWEGEQLAIADPAWAALEYMLRGRNESGGGTMT
jgi:Protein of unknown function (DUF1153)